MNRRKLAELNDTIYHFELKKRKIKECILNNAMCYYYFDEIEASIQFDRFKLMAENLEQLRGFNLACFCSLSSPCHVDILIELLQ